MAEVQLKVVPSHKSWLKYVQTLHVCYVHELMLREVVAILMCDSLWQKLQHWHFPSVCYYSDWVLFGILHDDRLYWLVQQLTLSYQLGNWRSHWLQKGQTESSIFSVTFWSDWVESLCSKLVYIYMYLLHNGIRSCTKGCSWQWWCLSELDKNIEWCLKCL